MIIGYPVPANPNKLLKGPYPLLEMCEFLDRGHTVIPIPYSFEDAYKKLIDKCDFLVVHRLGNGERMARFKKPYGVIFHGAYTGKMAMARIMDTIPECKWIGYITDYTSDRIYDLFYSNKTKLETPVEQENGYYLIDVDNDRQYDYQYDIITSNLSAYIQPITNNKETSLFEFINPYFPFILFIVGFTLLALSIFSAFKPKEKIEKKDHKVKAEKRPEKEKSFYLKEKKKQKTMKSEKEIVKSIEESRDKKAIENQIDEILSKKRQ